MNDLSKGLAKHGQSNVTVEPGGHKARGVGRPGHADLGRVHDLECAVLEHSETFPAHEGDGSRAKASSTRDQPLEDQHAITSTSKRSPTLQRYLDRTGGWESVLATGHSRSMDEVAARLKRYDDLGARCTDPKRR